MDFDKLCYWDLLRDMPYLGYNNEKMTFFFVDNGGVLNNIFDDEGTIALCDHLRRHCIVDVYIENAVELDANKEAKVDVVELDANNKSEYDGELVADKEK